MDGDRHLIQICMGSSCFSRGNGLNAELIQRLIDMGALEGEWVRAELTGTLCEGRCKDGPVIVVDGVPHTRVSPSMIQDLLRAKHIA
jgi:NADH:ubiquinone oxidoreductase subunit E